MKFKTFDLYNFNHGIKAPSSFSIDNFEISISKENIENLSKITQNGAVNLQNGFQTDPVYGEILPTASLKCESDYVTESILYDFDDRTSVDDFVLFLTFLNGRKVYLKEDISHFSTTYHTYSSVHPNFFINLKGYNKKMDLHDKFNKIKDLKLTDAFYYLTQAKATPDLIGIGLYANAVFDVISTRIVKSLDLDGYKTIKAEDIDDLTKILKSKAELILLENQSNNTEEVNDLVTRLNLQKYPSALMKMKVFFCYLNILQENPNVEDTKKLKHLNRLRNKLVHNGKILSLKNKSKDLNISISSQLIFILLDVCDLFFLQKIFELNDEAQITRQELSEFFTTGKYKDVDVYTETFEDYIKKIGDFD